MAYLIHPSRRGSQSRGPPPKAVQLLFCSSPLLSLLSLQLLFVASYVSYSFNRKSRSMTKNVYLELGLSCSWSEVHAPQLVLLPLFMMEAIGALSRCLCTIVHGGQVFISNECPELQLDRGSCCSIGPSSIIYYGSSSESLPGGPQYRGRGSLWYRDREVHWRHDVIVG